MIMIRFTVFIVLLSLVSVDSGNNTPVHSSSPNASFRPSSSTSSELRKHTNNSNNSSSSSSSSNISRGNGNIAIATAAEEESTSRDKRGTNTNGSSNNSNTNINANTFQLDQSELARQNQITQQIFANYLERRLFPNRSANQKIPTIADILPKPKPSARPRPRGFAASSSGNFKRSGGGSQRNRLQAAAAAKRQANNNNGSHRNRFDEQTDQDAQADAADDFDYDGQESLQSVESEQHDQYYGDIFHRDPSENEIDSDCPNCVDESQYTPNKWTMPLLKLGEKRYYLGIFFKANWFKATQYCRYHGMHLASISSQEENDRLEKHIRDFGLGHEHFWISGTDLADEGNFFWMATGRPITFTNWNAGEPNNFRYENGEEENCLELWNRDGKGLKWNDSPCSFETYFVCEVQPN
ncbi:WD repeat-containing protein 48 homolog isoform X1 [Drosophila willistoni]|uniref:WD repeat-containing protein 48 homolog isoform X1 n=1 Tax=Drosophila willistoni TaxID=7260 RepID=UPI000C26D9EE|nr:WD repeat-containing protein 48 homolog isoform X1 [Drosophila willistoni]